MNFIADFHIHSKYSRATSKNLDLENLYIQAQIKGITVLGTGDFTHPGWWREINEKLTPAEDGLFVLNSEIARSCDEKVPPSCRRPVRFLLVTEISNIYKKDGRTRKNHNLVFLPDLASAEKFRQNLDNIGNIKSDGRPILGLDARDLLEIVLETSGPGYLIPAHIWTPWFSVLGSKSGFDSVGDCFGDLKDHIFALETGLSSDPPMNWRVSGLDGYTLISNSDAHSPSKLGREANLFDTDLSFRAIRASIESADPERFLGTLEFFPEEGKYHLDGHRKCDFRSDPRQTMALNNICPVCQKPLTLGVLYRVEALSDRSSSVRPPKAAPYYNLIPLESILAEIYQCGANTKRVGISYHQLVDRFGSEFDILRAIPGEDLGQSGIPMLGEAIDRMRNDRVHFEAGYDGEYGRVTIFSDNERLDLCGQQTLFGGLSMETFKRNVSAEKEKRSPVVFKETPLPFDPPPCSQTDPMASLNAEQQAVVDHGHGSMIVSAGPGTGKTHTITCRMADLVEKKGVVPETILAVTFTNKAAAEMKHRLTSILGNKADSAWVVTFHGLCLRLLQKTDSDEPIMVIDDPVRRSLMADVIDQMKLNGFNPGFSVESALAKIVSAKQLLMAPEDISMEKEVPDFVPEEKCSAFQRLYQHYQDFLKSQSMVDFEDLIFRCVRRMETDVDYCEQLQHRFRYIFVDEFQDINHGQYRLMRLLAPENADLCVIGDPDQAIYGFRGSDVLYFRRFSDDYPDTKTIRLSRNYRSTETILETSSQVIRAGDPSSSGDIRIYSRLYSKINGFEKITIIKAPSAKSEAVQIGRIIEQMVGGTGFHSMDFGTVDNEHPQHSFADFAVLFRTGEQGRFIEEILAKAGIPCQLANRRSWMQHGSVARLLALMRVFSDQGTFSDLNLVNDVFRPALGKDIMNHFKSWAYDKQMTLARALAAAIRFPIPGLSIAQQERLVGMIRLVNELRQATDGLSAGEAALRMIEKTHLSKADDDQSLDQFFFLAADHQNITSFLLALALNKDTDLFREGVEKVALLTMHAAKGLEFPIVFIAGCEADLIPYCHPGRTPADDDNEERRLFYVAMTRARDRLFLTWSAKRNVMGRTLERRLSPFVASVEQRLKEDMAQHYRKNVQQQLSLF